MNNTDSIKSLFNLHKVEDLTQTLLQLANKQRNAQLATAILTTLCSTRFCISRVDEVVLTPQDDIETLFKNVRIPPVAALYKGLEALVAEKLIDNIEASGHLPLTSLCAKTKVPCNLDFTERVIGKTSKKPSDWKSNEIVARILTFAFVEPIGKLEGLQEDQLIAIVNELFQDKLINLEAVKEGTLPTRTALYAPHLKF